MKVYISQPTKGFTDEEIKATREAAVKDIRERKLVDGDFTLIDRVSTKDAPKDANDLWTLGKAILTLYNADYVYFVRGWARDPQCRVEHQLCMQREYEKNIISYQ